MCGRPRLGHTWGINHHGHSQSPTWGHHTHAITTTRPSTCTLYMVQTGEGRLTLGCASGGSMESEKRVSSLSLVFRSGSLIFPHLIRVSPIRLMEDEAWFAPNKKGGKVNAGFNKGS